MGCDIHGFVDFDETWETRDGKPYCANLGQFRISRNYALFGILAGVRDRSATPVSPPKGVPERMSYVTEGEVQLWVTDDEEDGNEEISEGTVTRARADKWHESHLEEVKRAETHGWDKPIGGYTDDTRKKIYHPDWHTHSWLTTEEVGKAIDQYCGLKDSDTKFLKKNEDGKFVVPEGYKLDPTILPAMELTLDEYAKKYEQIPVVSEKQVNFKAPAEMLAIYSAMKALEMAGKTPRFVFWFDN